MSAPNSSSVALTGTAYFSTDHPGIGLHRVCFPVTYPSFTDATAIITAFLFGCNGHITRIRNITTVPASTDAAAVISPTLGAVALTGGVLTLSETLCVAGAVVDSTAITALNTFTPTTPFVLTASGVTTFTEGSGCIEVEYINEDWLDVISSLYGLS